jgi:5'-nucleotidase
VLQAVRDEHPDLTILAAHAALRCDADACSGEIVSLARELEPGDVDLIVAGHPHTIATTEVNGIPIVQAGANGAALGVVDLFRTDGNDWRAEVTVRRVYADEVTPDASMLELLSRYQRVTDSLANRTIATLRDAPVRQGGENELGNIIADALRNAAQADVAFVGNGGIRSTVPAGPVTYGMLYAVMPFDNQLVRVSIAGRELRRLLEQALGRVHVSGVRITYDPGRGIGNRIMDARLRDGRPLADGRTYTLAVSDYYAEGGDGYTMLRDLERVYVGMRSLDALIAHLQDAPQPFAIPSDRRVVRVGR